MAKRKIGHSDWPWIEQTGLVTSRDLKHWERREGNPVLPVRPAGSFDDTFASDPCVLWCGETWAMFYYGLCTDGHARDGVALSEDLFHWEKSPGVLIDVGPMGTIDSLHAHKPSLFFKDDKLYHFYCAVAPATDKHLGDIEHGEIRGIAVATS